MLRRSRTLWAHPVALGVALTLSTFTLTGCPEDPDDPKVWIGKLDNPREQKEALASVDPSQREGRTGLRCARREVQEVPG
jgi:hypothetical protein